RSGAAAHRGPDPPAARRPAVRRAAGAAPQRAEGPGPEVGPAAGQAQRGGRGAERGADRQGGPVRPRARGGGEGGAVRVAGGVGKAVFARVEGYKDAFTLVSSATDLTGLQMVELFCARFRQEDGFRDLKQRLGWEECRAWTRRPIERTTQMLLVTLTALRLL